MVLKGGNEGFLLSPPIILVRGVVELRGGRTILLATES